LMKGKFEEVRECIELLMEELRPNMVPLVDAFNYSDTIINSTIGGYDGIVYEKLLKQARANMLTLTEPFDGYDLLQPNLDKEFLKKGNKYFGSRI